MTPLPLSKKTIRSLFLHSQNYELQAQIIKRLVSKIEVGKDFVRIHYFVGEEIVHTDVKILIAIKNNEIDKKIPAASSGSEAVFQDRNFLGDGCSNSLTYGAEERQVDEPFSGAWAVIQVEFDEIVEPKGLNSADLRKLVKTYRTSAKAASAIGASEAFVRQNLN